MKSTSTIAQRSGRWALHNRDVIAVIGLYLALITALALAPFI